ncbi:MAG: hypothetical protein CBC08_03870 [Flavobacteriaceae bacterium TMED48]|jgi:hypothetical protein|nr:MAG: hypothetical protein CBC08_03870 [Flavobacteriaceae bacterium TMED48]|tara:strand:+ start:3290 stop:3604 length:315 start_codon:yes stop_codon:yes gene_type:complete
MKNIFVGLLLLCYIFFYCKDSSLEESAIESRFSIGTQHFPIAKVGLVDLGIDLKKEFYEGFMNVLLFVTEGKYLGYPYRNHVKGTKLYGYSDHFPVYIIVGKKN